MKFFFILIILHFLTIIFSQEIDLKKETQSSGKFNISNFDVFECNDPLQDCSNNGECEEDKKDCICFHGYSTFFSNHTDHFTQAPRCNYKSKRQLYALVIASFISFGMVHFYLENYLIGYFQLVIFTFIFLMNCFLIIGLSMKHLKHTTPAEMSHTLIQIITIAFFTFVFILWYIFDIIMVISNMYRDGNNQELTILL
jgi:hypothetical protein